jgi:hypothetical protein
MVPLVDAVQTQLGYVNDALDPKGTPLGRLGGIYGLCARMTRDETRDL